MAGFPSGIQSPFGLVSPFGVSSGGGGAVPGALASRFDGSNDLISLTAANAGITDGPEVTMSLWFLTSTTSFQFFFKVNGLGTNFDLSVQAGGGVLVRLENTASTDIISVTSGGTNHDGSWHHLAFSANTTTGARQVFLDGAQVLNDTSATTGTDLDLASGTYAFPQAVGNAFDLSEIWIGSEYVDLATLNPFISGGLPTDLGADGSLATGTQPEIYSAAADGTNTGSGANFTITGEPESIAGPGA
jgi:hypothetical protein